MSTQQQSSSRRTNVSVCPCCRSENLVALGVGPDLRTVAVRCMVCGRESVIAVSSQ